MFTDIIENFWLGFAITAIPGAVTFEVIRRSMLIKSTVISFLAGNFTGMITVIALVFVGFTLITKGLIADILYGFNGGLLIYLGVSAILKKPEMEQSKISGKSAFGTGFILAVANPLSIFFGYL